MSRRRKRENQAQNRVHGPLRNRRTAIEGGCLCGAVRYRADGLPTDSMVCHCATCRRASGAPMVAWVTFLTGDFTITRGSPGEIHSSPDVVRTFCSTCGTPVTYANAGVPDEIDVTTCSLDDPSLSPPTRHSWTSHRVGWVRLDDGLPTHARSSRET